MPQPENPGSGIAVFGFQNFRLFQVARFCVVLATEMQSVAVGWQIYETTRRPLDLGLVGLAQFLPVILLFLVSGHVVDRFNRRNILVLCYCGFALCSTLLLIVAFRAPRSIGLIYAVLVLLGVVRSLNGPAGRAILPQLVPEDHFPSAVAWASSVFQTATILGPAVGGVAYAAFHGPAAVYATAAVSSTVAVLATLRIKTTVKPRPREPVNLDTVLAGFKYIWREKLILGSISLDLFAVLLGGAVALLPVLRTAKFSRPARGGWDSYAAPPQWEQRRWRFFWLTARCAARQASPCCGASRDLAFALCCSAFRTTWRFRWPR